MDILILRHGKAEKRGGEEGDDSARLLTPKGAREIRVVSKWMAGCAIAPDLIASSPLKRARETAEIVADELSYGQEIALWDELEPGSEPEALRKRLTAFPDANMVLLVGHEPHLSELIALFIGAGESTRIEIGKGGMAKIGEFSPDSGSAGVLEWLLTPDQIRDMA
jgi:phosphohistidine phosphatase